MSFVSEVFAATTEFLLRRLRRADKGWEKAMAHPKYRDEPTEERPFDENETTRYWFADTWRNEYHWLEGELYQQPDVRAGMVEGLSLRDEMTVYEPT